MTYYEKCAISVYKQGQEQDRKALEKELYLGLTKIKEDCLRRFYKQGQEQEQLEKAFPPYLSSLSKYEQLTLARKALIRGRIICMQMDEKGYYSDTKPESSCSVAYKYLCALVKGFIHFLKR